MLTEQGWATLVAAAPDHVEGVRATDRLEQLRPDPGPFPGHDPDPHHAGVRGERHAERQDQHERQHHHEEQGDPVPGESPEVDRRDGPHDRPRRRR